MARVARKRGLELGIQIINMAWNHPTTARMRGGVVASCGFLLAISLITYNVSDPSLNAVSSRAPSNALGQMGAVFADIGFQSLGLAAGPAALFLVLFGLYRVFATRPDQARSPIRRRALVGTMGILALSGLLAAPKPPSVWPLAGGLGGLWGDGLLRGVAHFIAYAGVPFGVGIAIFLLSVIAGWCLGYAIGLRTSHVAASTKWALDALRRPRNALVKSVEVPLPAAATALVRRERVRPDAPATELEAETPAIEALPVAIKAPKGVTRESGRELREAQGAFDFARPGGFALPELSMLAKPKPRAASFDEGSLRQNAQLLESVLAEFGVRGQIDQIRPGPVVTLYELVPAPGVKSARVVALSDDIARSMSVAACRVAVVPGRNAIGIELPNARRETVYLRDLLASAEYEKSSQALPMALGENIGGEPYIADLSKMPHLLIAGTTGSGKSVGVNAMILSILYRLSPEECRFIMIDPKMLELSVYDGIPHLLAPVVTDPKKAIVALKWTVREMEDRYRLMSKIGVRNVASYNERAKEAVAKGEHFERTVQTGFDEAGRPMYESERIDPKAMPYLVVVIDEVADLMMVAGKDVEGAVQRLAQMARAAGIHLVMATQRPSVDVITGTIKANFPTRISFQVTSKIDSRTILGEQGAEQLLGQGDMLYMAGGGRITRLHGPFVSDQEVEAVAKFLRDQGQPQYLDEVTAGGDEEAEDGESGFDDASGSGNDLYDRAVAVVTRDRKASTSYVQRRLQIGYNRAASLIERMEQEGVVSPANHAGKREVFAGPPPSP
jgi:DNA segregation ATPase FtsK/SpoIIIE, S-DNA-T family